MTAIADMINPVKTRGSIVVDEIIIPIVDIFLDGGCVIFIGRAYGSFPAVHQRDYAIMDESGGLVFRGVGVGGLSWRAVTCGSLHVEVPVSMVGKVAVGDGKNPPPFRSRLRV